MREGTRPRAHGGPQKPAEFRKECVGDFSEWTLRRVKRPLEPPNLEDSGRWCEGVPVAPAPPPCSSLETVCPGLLVVGTNVQGY